MNDVKTALEKIGLTEGESEVYEALVTLGLSSAGSIIKRANIASSKVYDVLIRLQNKGLVSHVIKNGVRYYDATPPERLIDFLEEKKQGIDAAAQTIRKILPEIKHKRAAAKEKTSVVVYTGLQGARIVLKETIDAGRKGAELLGFGTDEDPYQKYLPAAIEEHFRDQKKYNITWKLLFNRRFKSPSPKATVRYLPEGFNLPVRTMIYGHKVAIVDFNEPVTTIVIEKKEIVENYTKFFNFLWGIAKP